MIELHEDGRHLVVEVGGDPDYSFRFAPIPAPEGMNLLLLMWGSIAAAAADDLEGEVIKSGEEAMRVVLADHYDRINAELRDGEITQVFQAVMFWQIKGGSFELAKLSTSDPKAAWAAWSAVISPVLKQSLSNGAAPDDQTADGDTPRSSSKRSKTK